MQCNGLATNRPSLSVLELPRVSGPNAHLSVDTIRVRIQTHPSGTPVPLSLRTLVGHPILPRLYAGLPVALGFSVPALATYLTTYDGTSSLPATALKRPYLTKCVPATKLAISRTMFGLDADSRSIPWFKSVPIYLASGLTAEMVSGFIWTPMDVAKGRLQRGRDTHTTARALLGDVWNKEGYRGIFRVWPIMGIPSTTAEHLTGLLGLYCGIWVRLSWLKSCI